MPSGSVNCVVTSPPYWGLRDYGTAKGKGGRANCRHAISDQIEDRMWPGATSVIKKGQAHESIHPNRCAPSPPGDAPGEHELRRNFAAVLGLTRLRHGELEGRPGELPACNKQSN